MIRQLVASAVLFSLLGCQSVRVTVDCRLPRDESSWSLLDGPRYVIRGVEEAVEATLAFQEFADWWECVLREQRPALKRVPIGQTADLAMTLSYNVYDLGTGVTSYPVYSHYYFGYGLGGGRPYYGPRYHDYVGSQVETVHLGYARTLFVSSWVDDPSQPARRRVLWEGACDSTGPERSLKVIMPYLAVALGPYYGQSTEKPDKVRLSRDDDRVEQLRRRLGPMTLPAN